jgi:pimeloyl-ACP methyl ester carboxylesterase
MIRYASKPASTRRQALRGGARSVLVLLFSLLSALGGPGAGAADAELRYLTVQGAGGVPLAVVTAGDPSAPPVLLIHGIGQSHYLFHRQFESSLARDFFLVGFDLRGHGASGKPWEAADYQSADVWAGDVAAVLSAVGAERPLIVAWSFGTLVAMDYLRLAGPERIRGLLLTGALGALVPFRFDNNDSEAAETFAELRKLQFSASPADRLEAAARAADWLVAEPFGEEDRRVVLAETLRFPAYARKAIYGRQNDNADLLASLERLPVHLALGALDNRMMIEDAQALDERFDELTVSIYDGAGHSVFYERPARFNAELRQLNARSR